VTAIEIRKVMEIRKAIEVIEDPPPIMVMVVSEMFHVEHY
jgi:hypothetical protein